MAPSADLKARIDKLVKEKKVFVVSKAYCPFCVTAKVKRVVVYDVILRGRNVKN